MEANTTTLFLKMPKNLKKEVLAIAQTRKMNDEPKCTITSVVLSFIENGVKQEKVKNKLENSKTKK